MIMHPDQNQIVLETEVTNAGSLRLYERLGFIRSKRLHRYYLNGNTAFRLILYLKEGTGLKVPQHQDCFSDLDPPPEIPRPAPPT
jgi:peptide alpha-N-acetyltransferase